MFRQIDITFSDAPAGFGPWVIAPRPFDHWGQRFHAMAADGVAEVREIGAANSACRGYLLRAAGAEAPRLSYTVEICDAAAPSWVWDMQDNRYTVPEPALAAAARKIVAGASSEREALRRLVDDAAELFGYGHVETPFNAGAETVPLVCGLATGSCVDINTYLLAGARAAGLRGQYLAGYWFHPEKTSTADMHCWLAFEVDGETVFWDVAHGLKWAEDLGACVEEGLNPAGGRRVGVSCGRGLIFDTPAAPAPLVISHFCEPYWVGADGTLHRPELTIIVTDPDGLRVQDPRAHGRAAGVEETAA